MSKRKMANLQRLKCEQKRLKFASKSYKTVKLTFKNANMALKMHEIVTIINKFHKIT